MSLRTVRGHLISADVAVELRLAHRLTEKQELPMSRASYCRDQARLCREMATQLGLARDVERLRQMAARYDAEADALEKPEPEPPSQRPHG